MERRNWSLDALSSLKYIDTLDSSLRADSLVKWVEKYLSSTRIEDFNLELIEMKTLSELFHKNIKFLYEFKDSVKPNLDNHLKIKRFFK